MHRVAKSWKISSKFWKLTGIFGNLPEFLETYRNFWKLTGIFGNLPEFLETYRNFWKLTGILGNSILNSILVLSLSLKFELISIFYLELFVIFTKIV